MMQHSRSYLLICLNAHVQKGSGNVNMHALDHGHVRNTSVAAYGIYIQ